MRKLIPALLALAAMPLLHAAWETPPPGFKLAMKPDPMATRLKQNGEDVEGWLRLVRAYLVMGERDKAVGASADARQAVASDADRLRQLNEGLRTLGLGG